MPAAPLQLSHLEVLHAVLTQGSVAKAAAALRVTPSAVSNALARARDHLGDALFVRRGRGLTATPFVTQLEPVLRQTFTTLEAALRGAAAPDPTQTTRAFTLALSDAEQLVSLPRIAQRFTARFPRATLRVVTLDTLVTLDGLASGAVDATIGPRFRAEGLYSRRLFEEDAVLVVQRRHPRIRGRISVAQFNAERHVDLHLLNGRPGQGNKAVERFFASLGLTRTVAVTVPTFAAVASVVASTELIGGLPRRVAELWSRALPLAVVDGPAPPFVFELCLHWHERTHTDRTSKAFRAVVVDALAMLPQRPSSA